MSRELCREVPDPRGCSKSLCTKSLCSVADPYPKNLLIFFASKSFIFSEIIFKDPSEIPFKTSVKITS